MKDNQQEFDHDLLIRLDESVKRIERTLNDFMSKISNGYSKKSEVDELEKRIVKIESNTTWVVRVVGGIIIAAVLGLIIKQTL